MGPAGHKIRVGTTIANANGTTFQLTSRQTLSRSPSMRFAADDGECRENYTSRMSRSWVRVPPVAPTHNVAELAQAAGAASFSSQANHCLGRFESHPSRQTLDASDVHRNHDAAVAQSDRAGNVFQILVAIIGGSFRMPSRAQHLNAPGRRATRFTSSAANAGGTTRHPKREFESRCRRQGRHRLEDQDAGDVPPPLVVVGDATNPMSSRAQRGTCF